MVEVIYQKEENKKTGQIIDFRLPRNMKQIGEPGQYKKIYLEDYVYTYLKKLTNNSEGMTKTAVLLGRYEVISDGLVLFISGAMELKQEPVHGEQLLIQPEAWDQFQAEKDVYFPDLEPVGWYLSRNGFSTGMNHGLIKTHMSYFENSNRVLYIMDGSEGEDAFYINENGCMNRQKGYYIYYTKNPYMQTYMIEQSTVTGSSEKTQPEPVLKKDAAIVHQYRNKIQKKKERVEKSQSQLAYLAGGLCTVAVLFLGITIVNNYGKMQQMETTIMQMSETLETRLADNIKTTTKTDKKSSKKKDKAIDVEQVVEDAMTEPYTYYIVEEGDTLIAISKKMYQSAKYVSKLIEANEITDVTKLQPGKRLIIPTID
jgi:LysM repeat protein